MTTTSNTTIDIANDVMSAFKTWHKEKHAWFVNINQGHSSNYENDAIVRSISVIRCKQDVIIGISYMTGRHSNKFYRMLHSAFHKWCEDKVIRAIKRKYNVSAAFQDIGNHNPNPEHNSKSTTICSTEILAKTKSVVSW